MPNWCTCELFVDGDREACDYFKTRARGPEYRIAPSEAEIVHVMRTDHLDREEAIRQIEAPKEIDLSFHQIVPLPPYVLERRRGGEVCIEFQHLLWGVKWGATDIEVVPHENCAHERGLLYKFLTPWGPPIPFVLTCSRLFPDLGFRLTWDEPGMKLLGSETYWRGDVIFRDDSPRRLVNLDDDCEDEEDA